MTTSFGKFLRKLRIDIDETQRMMAEKLDCSPAFLSAVEVGKKSVPNDWINKICDIYSLNDNQIEQLTTAVANSDRYIKLDLYGANEKNRKLAVLFSKEFKNLNNSQVEKINKDIEEDIDI